MKRSIQNYHRLTPHEQQLQRHHQRQLQHQYETHQRELRERELRERQRSQERTQVSQYRATTNSNQYQQRDARRYQQMQQPPQQYNHQMYQYRHDFQNTLHSAQHQKSDETKEYTIEVLVAVDKKMQEYHGENLKNYVLTLMSVVSVYVVYLENQEFSVIKHVHRARAERRCELMLTKLTIYVDDSHEPFMIITALFSRNMNGALGWSNVMSSMST